MGQLSTSKLVDSKIGSTNNMILSGLYQHGVGFVLSQEFENWRNGAGGANDSFWDYIRVSAPYNALMVKYYGGTASAEKRRVVFKAGQLVRATDDTPFDTQQLETAASGQGWGIFVVSMEGAMYAHKHKVGVYHHSTFLSGSAVMAGENFAANRASSGALREKAATTCRRKKI